MQESGSILDNADTWINIAIAVIVTYLSYRFQVADKKTEDQKIAIDKEQKKQWEKIDANAKSIEVLKEKQSYDDGVRAGREGAGGTS